MYNINIGKNIENIKKSILEIKEKLDSDIEAGYY
jgi:hypothetical protein